MRVDHRTLDSATLTQWAHERGLPYLGALRNAPIYVQCIEQGVTLFDLPQETVSQDLLQWHPIVDWLKPVLFPVALAASQSVQPPRQISMGNETIMSARVGSLQPVQQSLVQGERLAQKPTYAPTQPAPPEKRGGLLEALGIPSFLRRK
jgi:chromosome partitioning protein